jgi:hypothetical protein
MKRSNIGSTIWYVELCDLPLEFRVQCVASLDWDPDRSCLAQFCCVSRLGARECTGGYLMQVVVTIGSLLDSLDFHDAYLTAESSVTPRA